MDESTGKLLPALPSTSPAEHAELASAYFLQSLSRNNQRARVVDPERNIHLLPSEPTDLIRRKLREQVIEQRRVKRQEEAAKGRPKRAMNTLRALMLKGNKQAEAEYFQRRQEEELERKQAAEKPND